MSAIIETDAREVELRNQEQGEHEMTNENHAIQLDETAIQALREIAERQYRELAETERLIEAAEAGSDD